MEFHYMFWTTIGGILFNLSFLLIWVFAFNSIKNNCNHSLYLLSIMSGIFSFIITAIICCVKTYWDKTACLEGYLVLHYFLVGCIIGLGILLLFCLLKYIWKIKNRREAAKISKCTYNPTIKLMDNQEKNNNKENIKIEKDEKILDQIILNEENDDKKEIVEIQNDDISNEGEYKEISYKDILNSDYFI